MLGPSAVLCDLLLAMRGGARQGNRCAWLVVPVQTVERLFTQCNDHETILRRSSRDVSGGGIFICFLMSKLPMNALARQMLKATC